MRNVRRGAHGGSLPQADYRKTLPTGTLHGLWLLHIRRSFRVGWASGSRTGTSRKRSRSWDSLGSCPASPSRCSWSDVSRTATMAGTFTVRWRNFHSVTWPDAPSRSTTFRAVKPTTNRTQPFLSTNRWVQKSSTSCASWAILWRSFWLAKDTTAPSVSTIWRRSRCPTFRPSTAPCWLVSDTWVSDTW